MDQTVEIESLKMSYSDIGSGSAIVFLHGWGTSKDTYSEIISMLSKKYRCINIDLPGFGKSDVVEDLTLVKISKLINKVIRKLGIKSLYLVGHSLGGAVTLVYASRYQEKINKLVLISPFVTFKQFSRSVFYLIRHLVPFLVTKILSLKNPNPRAVNAIKIVYYLSSIDLYKYLRKIRKDILMIFGTRDGLLSMKPLEPVFGVFNNIHLSIYQDVRHFMVSYNAHDLAEKIDLFFSGDTLQ
ncbi:MAG: alpha/beta superfamily hydrolase/acyltransferase [uncultured bacterium]|nr:MAG: alpha/beta superfamily hydrolase/acyltransferase [uncultured bacterium]